jgi:hypothetical protein
VNSCVNSLEDGPVGPKNVEIRRYMNKIKIMTSVGFSFHITTISLVTLFISSTVVTLVTKLTNISCFLRLGNRANIFFAADIT